jgi:hypothetical protein
MKQALVMPTLNKYSYYKKITIIKLAFDVIGHCPATVLRLVLH